MILPFENDTSAIIKRLSQRNFKSNLKQNKIMIVAIALVTFMMFTIFSTGLSFYKNYIKMNTRIVGTSADELITNLTEQQAQELQQLEDVYSVGSQIFAGSADVENKKIVLTYYDKTEWEQHIKSTVNQITGTFPEKETDIMLSENALDLLGIDTPFIGMEIRLNIDEINILQTFRLCGWYHDYVAVARPTGGISGNVAAAGLYGIQADANAIISETYAINHALFNVTTFCTKLQNEDELRNDLMLLTDQNIILIKSNSSFSGIYGICAAIAGGIFIMICGYLLIYNIAYISINKDIHFYGILKTLGTTPRQIKRIVHRQIKLLSTIAISIGLGLGCVVSIWVVPFTLNNLLAGGGLGDAMEYAASFSPIIFLFAAMFSFITVAVSCRKPAKEAGKISPIAAIRFTGINGTETKELKVAGNGTKLERMAFRNVFRDRKKAILVFFSLFMGLTIFLMIYTIFSSPDWELKERIEMPYDFTLNDRTLVNLAGQSEGQIDLEIIQKLSFIQGVNEWEIVYGSVCTLNGTDPVWTSYIEDKVKTGYAGKTELEKDAVVQINGITATLLSKIPLSQGTYDKESLSEFEAGNAVYLTPTRSGFVPENIINSEITITDSITGQSASYQIAGIFGEVEPKDLEVGQINYKNINSVATYELSSDYVSHVIGSIYMSETGIERLNSQPLVGQVLLNAEPSMESSVKQQLKSILESDSDIDMMSKSDSMDMYKESLGSILLIGTIFSFLLLFIGIINYVNTMTTTIFARQRELAILESIGMTKKQILTMIAFEGEIYAIVSLFLLVALGIPLTYGITCLLHEELYFMTFRPPIVEIICIAVVVVVICFIIPRRIFGQISKENLVERLRTEE